jgi:hypothetical protein
VILLITTTLSEHVTSTDVPEQDPPERDFKLLIWMKRKCCFEPPLDAILLLRPQEGSIANHIKASVGRLAFADRIQIFIRYTELNHSGD